MRLSYLIILAIVLGASGCAPSMEDIQKRDHERQLEVERMGYADRNIIWEAPCPACQYVNKREQTIFCLEYYATIPYQIDCDNCHNAYYVYGKEIE